MDTVTVSPKTLTAELKPICAAIRKQTTPSQRRDLPLAGAVRIQRRQDTINAAYLWDTDQCVDQLGAFPNPDADLDVLLDLDNAYALAMTLDPRKPAELTVQEWDTTITLNYAYGTTRTMQCKGQTLVVSQPSSCPGRSDVMRFKLLEV